MGLSLPRAERQWPRLGTLGCRSWGRGRGRGWGQRDRRPGKKRVCAHKLVFCLINQRGTEESGIKPYDGNVRHEIVRGVVEPGAWRRLVKAREEMSDEPVS